MGVLFFFLAATDDDVGTDRREEKTTPPTRAPTHPRLTNPRKILNEQNPTQNRADARELQLTRAPMSAVLQAEEDIRWCEKKRLEREDEARVMRHVPGWVAGAPTSATGRYIPDPRPFGVWDPMVR